MSLADQACLARTLLSPPPAGPALERTFGRRSTLLAHGDESGIGSTPSTAMAAADELRAVMAVRQPVSTLALKILIDEGRA